MNRILRLGLCALIGSLLNAGADEAFPQAFTAGKVEYRFSQPALEKSLSGLVDELAAGLKLDPAKRDAAKLKRCRELLAFAIAAAAQYAADKGEVRALLRRIIDLPEVANEPVPEGFLIPHSLFWGMASQAFVDSEGIPPDVDAARMMEANFGALAAFADRIIQRRQAE